MNEEVLVLKEQAEGYRVLYKTNQVSREEALEKIRPYIVAVNEKSKSIAKKYNMKPKLVTVTGYLR
ncbi:hypothetical protein EEL30_06535 [Brevibacillus laterosporus]|uniref:Uncharacterized protein n=1 Tax=Brevibacillus laterosporus TaxID=1465 RepID=A0A518V4Y5_BRELA|nr:hypothetical protein EEL30_06535 [Brevibacillus laterosporus]